MIVPVELMETFDRVLAQRREGDRRSQELRQKLAACPDPEALAELLGIELGGRLPMFEHEPALERGRMCWSTDLLPRVFVATDVWEALQKLPSGKASSFAQ